MADWQLAPLVYLYSALCIPVVAKYICSISMFHIIAATVVIATSNTLSFQHAVLHNLPAKSC